MEKLNIVDKMLDWMRILNDWNSVEDWNWDCGIIVDKEKSIYVNILSLKLMMIGLDFWSDDLKSWNEKWNDNS